MSKLERDFNDSLLMPMPAGKANEKDYQQDKVPGGMESLSKEYKADSGIRNNPNDPNSRTHFKYVFIKVVICVVKAKSQLFMFIYTLQKLLKKSLKLIE